MSAVEEVRDLLDTYGIKYNERDVNDVTHVFDVDYFEGCGDYLHHVFVTGECISVESSYLTPVQAINLIRKSMCYVVSQYNQFDGWGHFCSACGHRVDVSRYDPVTGEPFDFPSSCPSCKRQITLMAKVKL